MIFADKLIQLRKKAGWSQEELAEQMNVTRQSVSKWEGAQSVPDLDKMVRLSELFGVSTDYLLKDSMGDSEPALQPDVVSPVRRVSMEEANSFLEIREAASRTIALATFLCIVSPVCLLVLGACSELSVFGITENTAGGVGMIVLLLLVAAAVAMYILCGSRSQPYEYLGKEVFETEYGVSGMVAQRREQFRETYTRSNIIGTALCIMAVVPMFAGIIIDEENDLLMILMVSLLFLIVGVGVMFFIRAGVIWASYEKLLQEGDYTKKKKEHCTAAAAVSTIYWAIVTAGYLACSFLSGAWHVSWIIWVIAGALSPAVIGIVHLLSRKK